MQDWVVTVPKTITWEDYQTELDRASDPLSINVLNYRVAYKPKVKIDDRLFVVWNGHVRGWMHVCGIENHKEGFTCKVTGKYWKPGWYIQRTGTFHKLNPEPVMKGFQGMRRIQLTDDMIREDTQKMLEVE